MPASKGYLPFKYEDPRCGVCGSPVEWMGPESKMKAIDSSHWKHKDRSLDSILKCGQALGVCTPERFNYCEDGLPTLIQDCSRGVLTISTRRPVFGDFKFERGR